MDTDAKADEKFLLERQAGIYREAVPNALRQLARVRKERSRSEERWFVEPWTDLESSLEKFLGYAAEAEERSKNAK